MTGPSIQQAARSLLDALDRMHGSTSLSHNVMEARDVLRSLLPLYIDPRDATREEA